MRIMDDEVTRVLADSPAFRGVPRARVQAVLAQLECTVRNYDERDFIAHAGDAMRTYPVVLAGVVEARLPKAGAGGYTIVGRFAPGDSFAEAVPTTLKHSPVDIVCIEPSSVVLIPAARLEEGDDNDCLRVRANLLAEMSKKISELSYKLALFAEPRLRNRLLMYLQAQDADGSGEVTLEYNRKELASYLGVNDKALSRELRRLQDEGVLAVDGKRVRILGNA